MKKFFYLCAFFALFSGAPLLGAKCPTFKVDVTEKEGEDITYIVHTLAHNSTFGLWKYQKDLEAAGARTKRVSAFDFFAYLITNAELKTDLKLIIQKGGLPYRRFVNGFNEGFRKEAKDPCFDSNFTGFCKVCKLDEKTLKPIFEQCLDNVGDKGSVPFASFVKALVI